MADEREGADGPAKPVANDDKIQTPGREANDARPLNAADNDGGPERYPSTRRDPAEGRSFDPRADAPTPRQGAGDGSAGARQDGFEGPQGDPSEGRR
jgi:hypothetical protein